MTSSKSVTMNLRITKLTMDHETYLQYVAIKIEVA